MIQSENLCREFHEFSRIGKGIRVNWRNSRLRLLGVPVNYGRAANVYLNELDHHAKRDLKCRAYIRYVDDILVFAPEKEILRLFGIKWGFLCHRVHRDL
jgi:hypothetical protein